MWYSIKAASPEKIQYWVFSAILATSNNSSYFLSIGWPLPVVSTWSHLVFIAVLWGDGPFFLSVPKRKQRLQGFEYPQQRVESWVWTPVAYKSLCSHPSATLLPAPSARVLMLPFPPADTRAHVSDTCISSCLFILGLSWGYISVNYAACF